MLSPALLKSLGLYKKILLSYSYIDILTVLFKNNFIMYNSDSPSYILLPESNEDNLFLLVL
jgi:hypothetical protein